MSTVGGVLAGGLSSRKNIDKSELRWKDKTLVEHTKSLLHQAGCESVIINDNKHQGNVADRFVNSGPLAGIEASLHHLLSKNTNAQNMLIMPIDMPLMNLNLLKNLIQEAVTGSAVFYSLGRFPLLLPINQQLLDWLTASLEENKSKKERSIKKMLSHLPCKILSIDDDQQSAFYNCNTPEQWQMLQS